MGQAGNQKLKCDKDDHENEIDSVCYNQFCTEFRLNCFTFIRKGIHHSHLDDVEKSNSLIEYIEKQNKESDNLINFLQKLVENLNESFSLFKKGISYKYSLSKERLVNLNSQQINDFLNSTIKFAEYKESIINIISDQIVKLTNNLNNLYDQLNIVSFNYYQISSNDIKLSKQIYAKCQDLIQENKFKESIQLLDKSIQLDLNNYQALWCKGSCLKDLGRYEDAIIWFEKALTINPQHVNSLWDKGVCLRMLNRYEDAIIWLDKVLVINPKDINSLFYKGSCLQMLGRYEDSIIWLDKALAINPKDVNSLFYKGTCLRKMKRFNDSLKYLDQALSINPNHAFSLGAKGQLLEDQQKYEEAVLLYEKSLKKQSDDQWTINRKAFCENKLKL
ncbi:unnamed protein product [Paramecium primaurelia]|uniref:Tetratricopeptide repeat protein n=1 Tax=Paramecium primaurelia TaxID=5886 RepID=A0A8S1PSS7_PARPR|nr:unnamed protein product [Paramecium primaurelia]